MSTTPKKRQAETPRADPIRRLLRFPLRQIPAVLVVRERDGDGDGWLALAGDHGWLFGSHADAIAEARWLSDNFGSLPVREIAP